MKKVLLSVIVALMLVSQAMAGRKIRVACVGDSVTFGMRVENREQNCYPAQLQLLLGDNYDVRNFGHSGTTLLNHGHTPYTKVDEYRDAIDFKADIVIIHLGLNDTDPRDWPEYAEEFVPDYLSLIDDFRKANPDCKVYICRMTPIFHTHWRFKAGTMDWYRLEQTAIETVAQIAGTPLIDLQAPLYSRPDLMPDALHPNAVGAKILANTVYSALTGNYGGLKMAEIYSDNMVLQCERPLRIAGTANAGDKVTVRIAKQKKTATAAFDGTWEVELKPLKASFEPMTLEIATADRKLTFNNVLAGEVWLCSGQSNMAFRVNESAEEEVKAQTEYAATAKAARAIRLFDMKPQFSPDKRTEWDEETLAKANNLDFYRHTQWTECTPETAARFSAVGFAFGRMLADSLNRPVGLIHNALGGSPTESWISRHVLEAEFTDIMFDLPKNTLIQDWVRDCGIKNLAKADIPNQRYPFHPCYLFEAGIMPLDHFPIKGVIWYQGESNAHNIEAHEKLFKLLVDSWRQNWNDPQMPFHFVQLSSIHRPSWPRFRDSQRLLAQQIDHCEMAVCSDLGHPTNVHPVHKKDVGERLARQSLKNDYGYTKLTASGPEIASAIFDGKKTVLTFNNAKGLATSDGEALRRFEIAEFDGLYYPAEAVIENGKVILKSDKVSKPRFVRYAWQDYTDANLVNSERLPASTFKTAVKTK